MVGIFIPHKSVNATNRSLLLLRASCRAFTKIPLFGETPGRLTTEIGAFGEWLRVLWDVLDSAGLDWLCSGHLLCRAVSRPLAGRFRHGEASPCWRWCGLMLPPSLPPFPHQTEARTAQPWRSQTPAQRRTSLTSPPARWKAPGSPMQRRGCPCSVPKQDQLVKTFRGPQMKEV